MKTLQNAFLFVLFGVPAAFAAPENHEEFARQYMPESQAIFERFRKDCAETKKLRESLAEDLRVMNRPTEDDAGHWALCEKINELERRESEWAALIKDAFFKYKACVVTSERLAVDDAALAKKSLAWESDELKPMLKKSVAQLDIPATVKIRGRRYAFGICEVTQKEYEAVMGNNPSYFKGENLPVENVSWHDAEAFCKRLTARERRLGRISATQCYRLPTSGEWGHAEAMAGEGKYYKNSGGTPVGQKEPNVFGLYDMHGNVAEWTSTRSSNPARAEECVAVGNCWYSPEYPPNSRNDCIGFRVVLDPAP